MAQVKVYYDREGNTLTVWFGNPDDEYVAEETGEDCSDERPRRQGDWIRKVEFHRANDRGGKSCV